MEVSKLVESVTEEEEMTQGHRFFLIGGGTILMKRNTFVLLTAGIIETQMLTDQLLGSYCSRAWYGSHAVGQFVSLCLFLEASKSCSG